MIEFDEDGARQYAEKQLRAGANVVLPPPPFNCRAGYQEQYEIVREGIRVLCVSRSKDTAYGAYEFLQLNYTWKEIELLEHLAGSYDISQERAGRLVRLRNEHLGRLGARR